MFTSSKMGAGGACVRTSDRLKLDDSFEFCNYGQDGFVLANDQNFSTNGGRNQSINQHIEQKR